MWTIASVSSAQLCHIRDSVYEHTRRMLESLEAKDNRAEFADIEHVQARVLLLVYEFMRTNHQRGWISARRCFRLIQLMRLYEIDSPENVAKRQQDTGREDWIKTESKRRTFWVAYSLDRFINMRHEWPLTLNEQDVRPCLESSGFSESGTLIEDGRYPRVFPLPRQNSRVARMWRWVSCRKPSPRPIWPERHRSPNRSSSQPSAAELYLTASSRLSSRYTLWLNSFGTVTNGYTPC